MTENVDTSNISTTEEKKAPIVRVPVRVKTDKSLRAITKSMVVLADALGLDLHPDTGLSNEDYDKLSKEQKAHAMSEAVGFAGSAGDAVFETGPALSAAANALNDLVAVIRKIDPAEITDFRAGGAFKLEVGMVVVASKAANDAVRALVGDGRVVLSINDAFGTVKVEGIEDSLPRHFVARKDLVGRGRGKAAASAPADQPS